MQAGVNRLSLPSACSQFANKIAQSSSLQKNELGGGAFVRVSSCCCPFMWGGEAGGQEPPDLDPRPTTAWLAGQYLQGRPRRLFAGPVPMKEAALRVTKSQNKKIRVIETYSATQALAA